MSRRSSVVLEASALPRSFDQSRRDLRDMRPLRAREL